jgi:hypothetical protein
MFKLQPPAQNFLPNTLVFDRFHVNLELETYSEWLAHRTCVFQS